MTGKLVAAALCTLLLAVPANDRVIRGQNAGYDPGEADCVSKDIYWRHGPPPNAREIEQRHKERCLRQMKKARQP